ncbi:MAG: hypothetical protein B6245_04260 [Desulfobacteraceae bacterium 4572_88]|nr:MAG: hypothetical protein B6245_04260 [Desulfobacteraceae bacterium 4572_88]
MMSIIMSPLLQHYQTFNHRRYYMNAKHFSVLIFIICIAASGMARGASPAEQAGSDIRNMISKGNSLFQKGDFKHAAASWENALTVLDVGQFPDIHMDILPYLAHTCKTLGLHEKALGAFNRALPVAEKSRKHDRKALFFSHLADIHLTLADIENAVIFMEKAIAEAQLSKDPVILADILNNAGNLFIADGNYQEAAGTYRECLALLRNTADTAELKAKILINMAFAESFLGKLRADTLEKALEHTHSLPDAHIKAENYITLSLLMGEFVKGQGMAGNPLTEKILKALTEVRRISKALNNPRLMSQAYGHMGQLYENEERHDEALRLTRRAAFFAQQANMPELLYL